MELENMELEKRRRDLLETYKCVEKDYNQAYKLMYWAQCALDVEEDDEKLAELEKAYKYNYDVVCKLKSNMEDIVFKYKDLFGTFIEEDLEKMKGESKNN